MEVGSAARGRKRGTIQTDGFETTGNGNAVAETPRKDANANAVEADVAHQSTETEKDGGTALALVVVVTGTDGIETETETTNGKETETGNVAETIPAPDAGPGLVITTTAVAVIPIQTTRNDVVVAGEMKKVRGEPGTIRNLTTNAEERDGTKSRGPRRQQRMLLPGLPRARNH